MNNQSKNLINIVATGFVVMILLSLLLFWGRLSWSTYINNYISERSSQIIISSSGLVPGEPAPQRAGPQNRSASEPPGPNEPNSQFSQVYFAIDNPYVRLNAIGAFWDILAKIMPYQDVNEKVYYWYKNKNEYLCFDKRNGLISRHFKPDSEDMFPKGEFFAVPNGISGVSESSLGRFYDPIITRVWEKGPSRMCLYDKRIRRFYLIDFDERSVRKGLQLMEGDSREPVAIGEIIKGLHIDNPLITWNSPRIWNDVNSKWEWQGVFYPGDVQSGEKYRFNVFDWSLSFIPVLDKSGQIYIYNTSAQSLASAGYLPFPESQWIFEHSKIVRPRDVLDYDFCPVYAVRRLSGDPNKPPKNYDLEVKYFGMNAVCISREGTSLAAAVFDPNGNLVFQDNTRIDRTSTLASTIPFLLENLQPPVFEVASYLSGDYFEAAAGHRALFILPNSFLGMLGRTYVENFFAKLVFALVLLMGPSLILSWWLARKVWKDAKLTGLSSRAGKWWIAGTIAFGLPAYITYRLTRPKETLVTCQNCGKMRRPDMERCHRCGSKWEIPELTPPNWRICD